MTAPLDPIALSQALIRRPSVTPADAGAMAVVEEALTALGFTCRRMAFEGIENLYARLGTASPNLCFAGHTDVVPVGEAAQWGEAPFEGVVKDGVLHGRGAADMKSAVAAWIAAVSEVLAQGPVAGSLSFLITGDEEGVAEHGTVRVVEALKAEGEVIDHCIVGEPTSAAELGDMIKVGRRGSLNAWIEVEGIAGHVAYPDRAANPIPVLVRLLDRLAAHRLDQGYPEFQPSNLELTGLEVDNPATNVIPPLAKARLNIRFNPSHTGAALVRWLSAEAEQAGEGFKGRVRISTSISGEAFLTESGAFVELAAKAVEDAVGRRPVLSTTGGTSDARFIRALCPVIELGLVGTTMHQVNERVPVADVLGLTRAYRALIERYFPAFAPASGPMSAEATPPLGREVQAAAWGVLALVRFRDDWSLGFDASTRGFVRSFLGPALALPFYVLTAAVLARAAAPETPIPAGTLWGSGLTLLLDAIAFPALMAVLARPFGFAGGYCAFIVVNNWAGFFVNAMLAGVSIAALFGREGYAVFSTFAVVLFGLSIFITWRAARETLSRETAPALMAVVLSVGVGVLCDRAVTLALGLG